MPLQESHKIHPPGHQRAPSVAQLDTCLAIVGMENREIIEIEPRVRAILMKMEQTVVMSLLSQIDK